MFLVYLFPLVFLVIGFSLGGGLLYGRHRMRPRLQCIQDARPCKAGSPGAGLVKLHGIVKALNPSELLISPMEKKPCVYYKLVVQQFQQSYVSSGRPSSIPRTSGGSWVSIIEDVQAISMVVADDTGAVAVDPLEATLDFQQSRTHANLLASLPAEQEESLKARYKIVTKTWFIPKQMRYTEVVIAQDQPVFVVGTSEVRDGKARLTKKDAELLMTFRKEEQVLRNGKITSAIFMGLAVFFPLLFIAMTIGVYHSMFTLGPSANPNAAGATEAIATLKNQGANLSDRARAARKLAAMPVAKNQVGEVAPLLNPLLESKDSFQRDSAILAINKGWGSTANQPALKRILENTKDTKVQREVAAAKNRIGS